MATPKALCLYLLFAVVCAHPAFAGNSVGSQPPPLRERIAATYHSQVGVKEVGTNAGPEVNQYLKTVGLPGGYYWCAAFIKWTYNQNRLITSGRQNGRADSWFPKDRLIYQRTTGYAAEPLPADLGGLYYTNLRRIGHVFFVDRWNRATGVADTVEGNTNDGGSRNGDGVYHKRRLIRQIYAVSRWVPA